MAKSKKGLLRRNKNKNDVFALPLILGIFFAVLLVVIALLASRMGLQGKLRTALPRSVDQCTPPIVEEFTAGTESASRVVKASEREGAMNDLARIAVQELSEWAHDLYGTEDVSGVGAADVCKKVGDGSGQSGWSSCPEGCVVTAKGSTYKAVEPAPYVVRAVTSRTCVRVSSLKDEYNCTATASLKCRRILTCQSVCGSTITDEFMTEPYVAVRRGDSEAEASIKARLAVLEMAEEGAVNGDDMCKEAAQTEKFRGCGNRCPATEAPEYEVPSVPEVNVICKPVVSSSPVPSGGPVPSQLAGNFECTASAQFRCEQKLVCPSVSPVPVSSPSPSGSAFPSPS